jgi:UDP-2,3-diacylglucosamine pyrophosphatase LpxH
MSEKILTNEWEVSAFDRVNNEWTTTTNRAYEITDTKPDFINQAAPTKITPSRRTKPTRHDSLSVFIPDAQIPFHDEHAVAMAHLAVRELMPDNIVVLGDMMDFPAQGSFDVHPNNNGRLQEQLDRNHIMLAQFRADAPDAKIHYIPGNHEFRLQRDIIKRNAELLGIKRSNAAEELGVLTLDFLLRMKELEIEQAEQYPNGQVWLEDHLVAIHGTVAKQSTSTAIEYLKKDPHTSVVHGHTHRAEIQWRTTPVRNGYVQRWGMSPGTIADITGSVPSYGSSINEHGLISSRVENWQQAIGIAEHNENGSNPSLAMINEQGINIYGKQYE